MDDIEEVIFPALSLLFLVLGIVLIVQIMMSSFNPYDQIAFANAEKLRSAMNEACIKGGPANVGNIELKQNIPSWSWLLQIIPKWIIRNNGDPNYLLYYESFPAGQATGWEVDHAFGTRLIVPITDEFLKQNDYSGASVCTYVQNVVNEYESKKNDPVQAVVISNIQLSSEFRSDFVFASSQQSGSASPSSGTGTGTTGTNAGTGASADTSCLSTRTSGGSVAASSGGQKFFGYGKWTNANEETKKAIPGDNQFRFTNYLGLTNLEKTLIKYQTCGANSLCLKTRSGVYAYPLSECSNIKGVQMIYDARASWTSQQLGSLIGMGVVVGAGYVFVSIGLKGIVKLIWTGLTNPFADVVGTVLADKAAAYIGGVFLSFKESDLALASPCVLTSAVPPGETEKAQITVQKGSCKNPPPGTVNDLAKYPVCEWHIKYPLYAYNAKTGRLDKIAGGTGPNAPQAYHYACTENVNSQYIDAPETSATYVWQDSDRCLQLYVPVKPDGYCWTPDPWKYEWTTESYKGISSLISTGSLANFARTWGLTPVESGTGYIKEDTQNGLGSTFVLVPTDTVLWSKLADTVKALTWNWPGGLVS